MLAVVVVVIYAKALPPLLLLLLLPLPLLSLLFVVVIVVVLVLCMSTQDGKLVSWCSEPSQPQRIRSGLIQNGSNHFKKRHLDMTLANCISFVFIKCRGICLSQAIPVVTPRICYTWQ